MLDQVMQVAIFVSDMKRAVNFYSYVLGLPIITKTDRSVEFRTDGPVLAVKPRAPLGPAQGKPPASSGMAQLTFQVVDVEVAFADAKGRGARVIAPPRTVDAGRVAQLADPDGNIIELFEPEA